MGFASRFGGIVAVGLLLLNVVSSATAQYSGGSGTAQDPYQIGTAADLIALGETPADYDKHFILTADIDLDPNLHGRKVFDRAVIAGDADHSQGTAFTGAFDGNGHTVSHLTIHGAGHLGLFGQLGSWDGPPCEVKNLGVVDVSITGSGRYVGGLVGDNGGTVIQCYSTGTVSGRWRVGGLVGSNAGTVTQCYCTGTSTGEYFSVGGLVGWNDGSVAQCYSTGTVEGTDYVGGLVGANDSSIVKSVWDTQTSGLLWSAGGVGLTTAEIKDPYRLGLNGFANDPNWVLDAGRDYPRLAWEGTPGQIIPDPRIDWLEGKGTSDKPYRIDTAAQLIVLHRAGALWDRCFALGADIDLDPNLPARQVFEDAVIQVFGGVFDGNGHTISHLTIKAGGTIWAYWAGCSRGPKSRTLPW